MKIQHPKQLPRVEKLVTAYRVLQSLFTPGFITANIDIWNILDCPQSVGSPDKTFHFTIIGYGHGIGRVVTFAIPDAEPEIVAFVIKQFTSDDCQVTYSEFYESRHGNFEIKTLLHPLLRAKIYPVLSQLI